MSRYPFGLHGYHRAQGGSGKVEWYDPLNVFGSTYDPAAQAQKELAKIQKPLPVVEQPTPLPVVGDKQNEAARRKSLEDQLSRRGRASTVLTNDSSDKLGA